MTDDTFAPDWVAAVLPEEIVQQRALGWPNFHPEDFCHRCGRRNPTWYTDAETWMAATAVRARETGREGIFCTSCFVDLHGQQVGEQRGFLWRLSLEDVRDGVS